MTPPMDRAREIAEGLTFSDCGPDGGCEECDVCRYLNFLEWAGCVGKPEGSTVERNPEIERYLRERYPAILKEQDDGE